MLNIQDLAYWILKIWKFEDLARKILNISDLAYQILKILKFKFALQKFNI